MRSVRSFLRLPASERLLLVLAVVLLAAVRLGLILLRFDRLHRLLARFSRPGRGRASLPADRVAWAVTAAARRLPGESTCLSRALAAQLLLTRHGHSSLLRIGVARGDGILKAHAWLENSGRVILGGSGHEAFVPLGVLEGPSR